MENKPTWWQLFKIKLGLGVPFVPTVNLGQVETYVIKFKDYYIEILEGKDGELHIGWSKDVNMFPHTNMNDYWEAKDPNADKHWCSEEAEKEMMS